MDIFKSSILYSIYACIDTYMDDLNYPYRTLYSCFCIPTFHSIHLSYTNMVVFYSGILF